MSKVQQTLHKKLGWVIIGAFFYSFICGITSAYFYDFTEHKSIATFFQIKAVSSGIIGAVTMLFYFMGDWHRFYD